ncbi:MAG: VOC family protein [Acidimicrobiales bacterium]
MKVTRILHASVNVAGSLPEASRFYGEVLGMPAATRPEIPGVGGRWLAAGDGQVHLVDAPMAGAGIDPTGPHFCLAVEDIGAAVAELEDLGIPYFRAGQPSGPTWRDEVVQIWFTDPAGNTVELQEDRPL